MNATPVTVWESLQTQGQAVAKGIPYIDPTTLQPNVDVAGVSYDATTQETSIKKLAVEMALAGVPGNIALNAMMCQVQIAAGQQSIVLTNDRIEADSLLTCTVATDDATAFAAKGIVTGVGAATIKLNAVATGITKVNVVVWRAK